MERSRGLGIRKLFEGHYRTLEGRFASLVATLPGASGGITVVAADAGQLERLRRITVLVRGGDLLGGIRFLPGMVPLAEKLSLLPLKAESVGHADRTLFALAAMEEARPGEPLHDLRGNAETAHSMAGFFEDLLDQGIGPSAYRILADSDPSDSATVDVVGRVFGVYEALRGDGYVSAGSGLPLLPIPAGTAGTFLFYGFYDLNPGQRSLVRRLAACPDASLYWFSPLGELSPWAPVYLRTREFLDRLGVAETVRCDGDAEMGRFASFFETLPARTKPVAPHPGFGVIVTAGPLGTARAVLSRVGALASRGISPSSVAVVCRSPEEGAMIARLAWHEGVPVAAPLESDAASMPFGRLLTALLDVEADGFHYLAVQRLAMSGFLKPELSPEPSEILAVVLSSGVRMGRERWMDWVAGGGGEPVRLRRLLSLLCPFFRGLPEEALPREYAASLERLFVSAAAGKTVRPFLDLLLDTSMFRASTKVPWTAFTAALRIHLGRVPVTLADGLPDGFRILTPERIRGMLFDSVLVTGMEEGVWPSVTSEDPRLPDSFRKRLELPLKKDREIEDGFLLRQVGEAAGQTLDLILKQRTADGSEIYPSPFIAPLIASWSGPASGGWLTRESSSPGDVLLGGTSQGQVAARQAAQGRIPPGRPFLGCVVRAEEERFGGGAFGPWDGILDDHLPATGRLSASLLETYAACPFLVLAGRVWDLRERPHGGVSAEPDPLLRGNVLHRAVESHLMEHGFTATPGQIREALHEASRELHVREALGSGDLEDLFLGSRVESLLRFIEVLAPRRWSPCGREVELAGTLGTLDIGGRPDLLLEDAEGRLVVLDLKSGKLPGDSDTKRGRLFQLPFYHVLAAGMDSGREVAGVHYASLSDRAPGSLSGFTGGEMEELLPSVTRRAEALAGLLRAGLFPPLPDEVEGCKRCTFRHLCRRTPEERLHRKAAADPRLAALRREV